MTATIHANELEALYEAVSVDADTVAAFEHDAKLDTLGVIIAATTKALDDDTYSAAVIGQAVHVIDASFAELGLRRLATWPPIKSSSHLALAETRNHANNVLLNIAANNLATAEHGSALGGDADGGDADTEAQAWSRLVRSWHRLASKVESP